MVGKGEVPFFGGTNGHCSLVHEPTTETPEPVVEPLKEGLVFLILLALPQC